MNKMNKKQLLRFITEVSFALDDIALYLDLHPDCTKALSSYDNYQSMRTQAINDYVNMYGPLNKYQVTDSNYSTGSMTLGHGKESVTANVGL